MMCGHASTVLAALATSVSQLNRTHVVDHHRVQRLGDQVLERKIRDGVGRTPTYC